MNSLKTERKEAGLDFVWKREVRRSDDNGTRRGQS